MSVGSPPSSRPRIKSQYTIGRLMFLTAWAAGLLAAFRAYGATVGPILSTSLSAGWLAWRVASGRARLAMVGVVVSLVAWPCVALLPVGGPSPIIEAGVTVLFLGYPILLGFGLAWCQADEQRETVRLLVATVCLSLMAGAYLPILGFLVVRAVR